MSKWTKWIERHIRFLVLMMHIRSECWRSSWQLSLYHTFFFFWVLVFLRSFREESAALAHVVGGSFSHVPYRRLRDYWHYFSTFSESFEGCLHCESLILVCIDRQSHLNDRVRIRNATIYFWFRHLFTNYPQLCS